MKLAPLLVSLLVPFAACGSGTGPTAYTVLIQPLMGPIAGPNLWRLTDSAAPATWSAPLQGWDSVGQSWCVRVPTTERVLTVRDSAPGGFRPHGTIGYLQLSWDAPSWSTAGTLDSTGHIAFQPSPAC